MNARFVAFIGAFAGLVVVPATSHATTASTPLPYAGDFDGDGRTDLYWARPGDAPERMAFAATDGSFAVEDVPLGGTDQPLVGDFDGDGAADVLHYTPGQAADRIWYGGRDRGMSNVAFSVDGTYRPVVGDFDGDKHDDVFWYAPGRTHDTVWYGTPARAFESARVDTNVTAVPVVGDFDADGHDDIRWYTGKSRDSVWYGSARGAFTKVGVDGGGAGVRPVVGDFDADGSVDVLWYPTRSGTAFVDLGSRVRIARRADLDAPAGGTPVAGDFDGDHASDLLVAGAHSVVVYGSPAGLFTSAPVDPPAGLRPVVGDFDGDRRDDVYWAGRGSDVVWRGQLPRGFAAAAVWTHRNRVPALDPAEWAKSMKPYAYVAHAMGLIDTHTYTNSKEAFAASYAAGFRVFETDLVTLKDGTILTVHNDSEQAFGLTKRYDQITYPEIRGRRYDGKYTPFTGPELVALMRSHRDIYVILDTKWARVEISRRLLLAAADDPQVARRIMPHIEGQTDLDAIRQVYPLQSYVVALYRTEWYGQFDDDAVLKFVRKNGAPAVMMWIAGRDRTRSLLWNGHHFRRYDQAFAQQLQAAGAVTYVHSTADRNLMLSFQQQGIGVYSNGPYGPDDQVTAPVAVPPVGPAFAE